MQRDNCLPESPLAESLRALECVVKKSRMLLSATDFSAVPSAVVERSKTKSQRVRLMLAEANLELTALRRELKPAAIPWLPADDSAFNNMTFLSGWTPWSFVLTYALPPTVNFSRYSTNTLQHFLKSPRCGDIFLCCKIREGWFRGMCMYNLAGDRLKVVDIDSNETHVVHRHSVYHIPEELCEPHALAIHCTLMEESVPGIEERFWSPDLEVLFRRTLKTQPLRIKILKKLPSSPPKYVTEVIIEKADGQEINLSDWFFIDLIPGMIKKEVIHESSIECLTSTSVHGEDETCLPDSEPSSDPGIYISRDVTRNLEQENASVAQDGMPKDSLDSTVCEKSPGAPSNTSGAAICLLGVTTSSPGLPRDPMSLTTRNLVGPRNPSLTSCRKLEPVQLPEVEENLSTLVSREECDLSLDMVVARAFPDLNNFQRASIFSILTTVLNDPVHYKTRKPLTSYPSPKELVIFTLESGVLVRGVVVQVHPPHTCHQALDIGGNQVVLEPHHMRTPLEKDCESPLQKMRAVQHDIRAAFNLAEPSEQFYLVVRKYNPEQDRIVIDVLTEDHALISQILLDSGSFEIIDAQQ